MRENANASDALVLAFLVSLDADGETESVEPGAFPPLERIDLADEMTALVDIATVV